MHCSKLHRHSITSSARASAPHVFSAFPLLKIEDYRY
jgi:hypothetical protein